MNYRRLTLGIRTLCVNTEQMKEMKHHSEALRGFHHQTSVYVIFPTHSTLNLLRQN